MKLMLGFSGVCKGMWILLGMGLYDMIRYKADPQERKAIYHVSDTADH